MITQHSSYNESTSPSNVDPPRKRHRTSPVDKEERKKVSRACDACKEKKVRCAGTQPCLRCVKQSVSCTYNKAHRRGRPGTPKPSYISDQQNSTVRFSDSISLQTPDLQTQIQNDSHNDDLMATAQSSDLRRSTRSSQEPDGGRFEGDYIGPASGIAFLHRAQKRFHADYAAIKAKASSLPSTAKVSVFAFGDGLIPDVSQAKFMLPAQAKAESLLDHYFNFAMPTYRFLHRPDIEVWMNQLYGDSSTELSNAKKAIVILIMATSSLYHENASVPSDDIPRHSEESDIFYTEADKLLSSETGPIRLESVQARLAQCIHLLASSRINQAWYTFGTATQMTSALGLHRKSYLPPANSSDSNDSGLRKRVFWSAYTLDRYLSVILGRPKIFHDEDIDPSLSEESGSPGETSGIGTSYSQSVSEGPVFHAKLAKILGAISSELYATSRMSEGSWLDSARKWTLELKKWKESLPPFLDPSKVDPSMLVPIFQRQSTVLRLAYAHAMILANRPSLLSRFADLQRIQGIPSGLPTGSLKECIDAALEVVVTVNSLIEAEQMRKAFWFTHYISFCAISALYVYTIQHCLSQGAGTSPGPPTQTTRYFEAAAKCQESIENTTTTNSPFQRYNIILAELKKEVLCHLNDTKQQASNISQAWRSFTHTSNLIQDPSTTAIENPRTNATIAEQPVSMDPQQQEINHQHILPQNFSTRELPNLDDDARGIAFGDNLLLDTNAFGQQGDLMSWSEFDSCAINWAEGYDDFAGAI